MKRTFSKSSLLSFRQCPKRLWLEIHHPDLLESTEGSKAIMAIGHSVGSLARQLFDPANTGTLLDYEVLGFKAMFSRTQALLPARKPIFEAAFADAGIHAIADVLLPVKRKGRAAWRMVEVKSSSSVKDYHRDDAAIQATAARAAGLDLESIAVAHVNSQFVYARAGDWGTLDDGILTQVDLTEEAFSRDREVRDWVAEGQAVLKQRKEPKRATGAHCSTPFSCGFYAHCASQEPQPEYPVQWLPRVQTKALKARLAQPQVRDMRDVSNTLLNPQQLRVKQATLGGKPFFDWSGSQAALASHGLPATFLDFETINPTIPLWVGTRPFAQIPFQFSAHRLSRTGVLKHVEFLDLSGQDPRLPFATALVNACGKAGPIFVYNQQFEKARVKELATRFAALAAGLLAIADRMVDLLPITEKHYYHPSQQGSWSLKNVLPAIAPRLSYSTLQGVQDGGAAIAAYGEAIHPDTTAARKAELHCQLLAYCRRDTFALVKLWAMLANRTGWRSLRDA